jgi:hypothetical protein
MGIFMAFPLVLVFEDETGDDGMNVLKYPVALERPRLSRNLALCRPHDANAFT